MKTLKVRIKDKHSKVLNSLASEVNMVWNYVNDLCYEHYKRKGEFLSAYDISPYTAGTSKICSLHSQTIQAVTEELVNRKKQFSKLKLNWRVSGKNSAKRSLGWIPFKKTAIKYENGFVSYKGLKFGLWDSYGISNYCIRMGNFVEDSSGKWYACFVVDVKSKPRDICKPSVGIDLGLKNLATCSDGRIIENPRYFLKYEENLKTSQRAKKKKRTRSIHAKIKNCRTDYLQKSSTDLVKDYSLIVVGDISASTLATTKFSKSVNDSGFSSFRNMLKYKCEHAGVLFLEVDEAYTTQMCSSCRSCESGPKGRAGLGIREWKCVMCGTHHNRDVNSALNILALGHKRLAGGSSI